MQPYLSLMPDAQDYRVTRTKVELGVEGFFLRQKNAKHEKGIIVDSHMKAGRDRDAEEEAE